MPLFLGPYAAKKILVQVHVDHLSPVRRIREDMGFNLLVLPEEHKQIIQAQVQEHFRKKMSLASSPDHSLDLVRGKGQGLIILLHGNFSFVLLYI